MAAVLVGVLAAGVMLGLLALIAWLEHNEEGGSF